MTTQPPALSDSSDITVQVGYLAMVSFLEELFSTSSGGFWEAFNLWQMALRRIRECGPIGCGLLTLLDARRQCRPIPTVEWRNTQDCLKSFGSSGVFVARRVDARSALRGRTACV